MTATAQTPAHYWTIAIRPTVTRGIFHRVDLALTWEQAVDLAQYVAKLLPAAAVWYVPNADYDARHPGHEDAGNVMVDTGARIRIKDDGELPFDTSPKAASTIVDVEPGNAAGWRWITFADDHKISTTLMCLARCLENGRWLITNQAASTARQVDRALAC